LRNAIAHANYYYDDHAEVLVVKGKQNQKLSILYEEFDRLHQFCLHWILQENNQNTDIESVLDEEISNLAKKFLRIERGGYRKQYFICVLNEIRKVGIDE
jgi:hypothetical protein